MIDQLNAINARSNCVNDQTWKKNNPGEHLEELFSHMEIK